MGTGSWRHFMVNSESLQQIPASMPESDFLKLQAMRKGTQDRRQPARHLDDADPRRDEPLAPGEGPCRELTAAASRVPAS